MRRMKVLLRALVIALPCIVARAAPIDEAVAALCLKQPTSAQALDNFDAALIGASEQAMAWACVRWREDPRLQSAVDVALAAAHGDEPASAANLVERLRADTRLRTQPALLARADRAALVLAHNAKDYKQVAELAPVLRAALQATGQTESVAMLELRLLEAAAARQLRRSGWAEQAEAALTNAEQLLIALGLTHSAWAGELYNARSILAYAHDDIPGALRWAERELAAAQAIGQTDDPELIHTYLNIASYQYQLHQLDLADQTYRSARALAARHSEADPYALSGLHANYAVFLFSRGRFQDAQIEASQADAIARKAWGERSPRRVQPLIHLAESYLRLNRFKDALQTLGLALDIAEPARANVGPLRLMRLHEDRAQVLLALGQLDAASAAVDAALAQDTRGDLHYWRARSQWQRALLLARRGQWSAAEADLAAAEPLLAAQVGADNPWLLQLTGDRCRVQLHLTPPAEACTRLAQASSRADESAPYRAYRLDTLADAAQARGDAAGELALRLGALAAAQHVEGPVPLWRSYAALARLLRKQGQGSLAVLMGKQAVEALQALRRDANAEALSMERDFLSDKRPVYETLADWLTEDGRLAEALATLDLLKAQEFHDFTRGSDMPERRQAALPLTPSEQRELPLWRPEGTARDPARPPEKLDLAEQQAQRERRTLQLAAEAERVARWQARLTEPAAAQSQPQHEPPLMRAALGEIHLHAYALGTSVNLVIDSANGRRLQRLPLPAGELDRRIGQWLSALTARRDDAELTRYFGGLLAKPLRAAATQAGARRVVLHLSGNLRYLPWAALDDGQGPLGASFALEQATTQTGAGAPMRQARLQVLALTGASGTQAALPALAQEVCAIVNGPLHGWTDAPCLKPGALPGQAWLNAAFTREQFGISASAGRPQRHDLLHLASHFTLKPGLMSASWLQLGDGSRMSLADMATLDFKDQDLVTLSACETGLGLGSGDGAEVEGMNQLILRRGAAHVLASLWRVEDRSTAALMAAFYRALAAGETPAAALARAQAEVRAKTPWRAPFFWAGFYLASP